MDKNGAWGSGWKSVVDLVVPQKNIKPLCLLSFILQLADGVIGSGGGGDFFGRGGSYVFAFDTIVYIHFYIIFIIIYS